MQLICRYDTPDYAAWKSAFDADTEDRMHAGLTTLQVWRDADGPAALVLFEVNDRARAEAHLGKEAALGRPATATYLRTA